MMIPNPAASSFPASRLVHHFCPCIISCLLQKPLHQFLPCTELSCSRPICYMSCSEPSSKSLPCTITCILSTLLHMLSNNLAANNDSIEIHGRASKHIIECSVSKRLSVKRCQRSGHGMSFSKHSPYRKALLVHTAFWWNAAAGLHEIVLQ